MQLNSRRSSDAKLALPIPGIRSKRGVAIVIVLAMIVLVSGLIVAFFSRAVLDRQISNNSANQSKVELFAQGAIDTVIGDLKQEIVVGSTATAVTGGTVYLPISAAYMLPTLVVGSTGTSTGLENVVKISLSGSAFYPAIGGNTIGPARASSSLSTGTSLNGRYMTLSAWNLPLFMPTVSATDYTPYIKMKRLSLPAPAWILVDRSGQNPTSTSVSTSMRTSGTNPVIGRYAYIIYNEGGLLDLNVAGYPMSQALPGLSGTCYKGNEVFADLTQIPGISSSSITITAGTAVKYPGDANLLVDNIVGWRNNASLQTSGSIGSYSFSVSGTDYNTLVLSNTTGFLTVSGSTYNTTKTDRMFPDRQELISFLLQRGSALSGSTALVPLQNALCYLTHFSRGLEQPSISPLSGRPKVLGTANGGNYEGYGNDDAINPAFLSVRVSTSGTRNDGSTMTSGEPLVKKRFALNRLAWLTYKGPSALRTTSATGTTGANGDIGLLKQEGITADWLDKGTADNIKSFFGLQWNSTGYWTYDYHSSSGIKTLAEVAAAGREPDFFELLKAAINVGCLGTSMCQVGTDGQKSVAMQYELDNKADVQIIQIGANIIDQFDIDGFPTRILFTDSAGAKREIRGVENLPYLYRMRTAAWRIADPVITSSTASTDTGVQTKFTWTSSGTAIMVQIPEVWNPHSYDTDNPTRSAGVPCPTDLKLYAYSGLSATNGDITPNTTSYYLRAYSYVTSSSDSAVSEATDNYTLSKTNSEIDFSNDSSLYREPTMLVKPGSGSAGSGSVVSAPGFLTAIAADGFTASSGGISIIGTPTPYTSEPSPTGVYIGVYMGKVPILWDATTTSATNTCIAGQIYTNDGVACDMTYQVLCDNPNDTSNPEVYSEICGPASHKTTDVPLFISSSSDNRTLLTGTFYRNQILGWSRMSFLFDPRTSRFGMLGVRAGTFGGDYSEWPVYLSKTSSKKWVNEAYNMVPSIRPEQSAGYGAVMSDIVSYKTASAPGWRLGTSQLDTGSGELRFGLIAQNGTGAANNGKRFSTDTVDTRGTSTAYYWDPDGVVRPGMAAYMMTSGSVEAPGQPLATSYVSASGTRQFESRPVILNRPFRSVGELGYVFSGTPWKNLDMSTPQSGYASLLDLFCITPSADPDGLVAGKVNLNTRLAPVLSAILAGAYRDEYAGTAVNMTGTEAATSGSLLVAWTSGTTFTFNSGTAFISGTARISGTALINVSDLVGTWVSGSSTSAVYHGFSEILTSSTVSEILTSSTDTYLNSITRYRESAIRALAATGQTRVWNLMIDVVAQTGRYPQTGGTSLDKFVVEGESRYWVHLAIDRFTGKVLDKQIEVVKE